MKLIFLLGVYLLSGNGGVNGQDQLPSTEVGPCFRRPDGFARDLVFGCQTYIICQNGMGTRGRCPGLLRFDAENQQCWWREEVTCFECPRDQFYALIPVPHTCYQFYRCYNRVPSIHTCPAGLVFDPNIRHCNFITGTGCEGDETLLQTCPPASETPVFLADAYSCSTYYVCFDGRPIARQCAPGLHFNPILRICDLPENANCAIQDPSFPGDDEWGGGGDGGIGGGLGGTNQAKACPDTGHGFVPHASNCNAYFACNNQQATLINCAPGLHWDYERETCDRPINARCWSHDNPNPSPIEGGGGGLPPLPPLPGAGGGDGGWLPGPRNVTRISNNTTL